jgi:hypothetical protein
MSSLQEFLAYLEQAYIKVMEYGSRLYGPPTPPMEIVTSEEVKDILCPSGTDHIILCGHKLPVRAAWAEGLQYYPDGKGYSEVYIRERSQNCETDER